MNRTEVLVIGGGLAGLGVALELLSVGISVTLLERKTYPFHKVCGEYLSLETLPLFERWEVDPFALGAKRMRRFQFTSPKGKSAELSLPLGAFSLSRYTLDAQLYQRFLALGGVGVLGVQVQDIRYEKDESQVSLSDGTHWRAKIVIGAFGKRTALDRKLSRPFFQRRSPYLGVKFHARLAFPDDLVSLHNFQAGYCGISRIEGEETVNICYLTSRNHLRKYKSIPALQEAVLYRNPHLKKALSAAIPLFDKPLAINEISFASKQQVVNHTLMIGDAAGMIMPLSGNGMAMAIRGAYLGAGWVRQFLAGTIDRSQMEKGFSRDWRKHFQTRLWTSRQLEKVFQATFWSELSVPMLNLFPQIGKTVIRKTHGQEFGYEPYVAGTKS